MKSFRILFRIFAFVSLTSCDSNLAGADMKNKESITQDVSVEEFKSIVSAKELLYKNKPDAESLHDLMKTYAEFANSNPEDIQTPVFLYRRADLMREKGRIRESIRMFESIHDGYPDYPQRSKCAFLVAFLYQTELNDKIMAEKLYTRVMEIHPGTQEAEMAQISLKYLHETPDEMMERIKAKNN